MTTIVRSVSPGDEVAGTETSEKSRLRCHLAKGTTILIHGGQVVNAHACNAIEATGSRPTFGGISEIYFSIQYSLRHGGT